MRPLRPLVTLLLPIACAAPQSAKMSFQEAYQAEVRAPKPAAASPAPPVARSPQAGTSRELQSALLEFGARSRSSRAEAPHGTPMPASQAANWRQVGVAVDRVLASTPAETSSFDLVRARVTLEAELEADAGAYGDFPPDLAERVLEQVTGLAMRMSQVRQLGVKPRRRQAAFAWPVEPVVVTSLYGRRLHPLTRIPGRHFGLDLAADEGQLVSAAAAGVVLFAGWSGAYGREIELLHPGGEVTRYGHLSQLLVEPGLRVGRGDPLGLVGNTGVSTGPHLHFEVVRDGKPCDPLVELGRPPQTAPAWSRNGAPGAGIGGSP